MLTSLESVEYLMVSSSYNYGWVSSSNGSLVENAVTVNVPRSSSQYIGRKLSGASTFLGPVARVMGGLYYADAADTVNFTGSYDVLVCSLKPVNRTAPKCRKIFKCMEFPRLI